MLRPTLVLAVAVLGLCGCSLVTVPVEPVGSVVSTTVKTAGAVATAPFKAIGGGSDEPEAEPAEGCEREAK